MKTKKLTFTNEELSDIQFALFIHSTECLLQKCQALYEAETKLYKKIKAYLEEQS